MAIQRVYGKGSGGGGGGTVDTTARSQAGNAQALASKAEGDAADAKTVADGALPKTDVVDTVLDGDNKPPTSNAVFDAIAAIPGAAAPDNTLSTTRQNTVENQAVANEFVAHRAEPHPPLTLGTAGQVVQVNAAGNGLEYADPSASVTVDAAPTDGSTNAVSSDGVFDALAAHAALSHPPTTLGTAGQILQVNAGASALEYVDPAAGATVDPVPTDGSTNAVQSDGVFDALAAHAALLHPPTPLGTAGQVVQVNAGATALEYADLPAAATIDAVPVDGSTNAVQSDGVFDALAAETAARDAAILAEQGRATTAETANAAAIAQEVTDRTTADALLIPKADINTGALVDDDTKVPSSKAVRDAIAALDLTAVKLASPLGWDPSGGTLPDQAGLVAGEGVIVYATGSGTVGTQSFAAGDAAIIAVASPDENNHGTDYIRIDNQQLGVRVWATGLVFTNNEIFQHEKNLYHAVADFTAGATFIGDAANFEFANALNTWVTGKDYTRGEAVGYFGATWSCISAHTSSADFFDDDARWICYGVPYANTVADLQTYGGKNVWRFHCRENDTTYEFSATSGATANGVTVLVTKEAGTTRWLAVNGRHARDLFVAKANGETLEYHVENRLADAGVFTAPAHIEGFLLHVSLNPGESGSITTIGTLTNDDATNISTHYFRSEGGAWVPYKGADSAYSKIEVAVNGATAELGKTYRLDDGVTHVLPTGTASDGDWIEYIPGNLDWPTSTGTWDAGAGNVGNGQTFDVTGANRLILVYKAAGTNWEIFA